MVEHIKRKRARAATADLIKKINPDISSKYISWNEVTKGFQVRIPGVEKSRTFSLKKYPDQKAALDAAAKYRDNHISGKTPIKMEKETGWSYSPPVLKNTIKKLIKQSNIAVRPEYIFTDADSLISLETIMVSVRGLKEVILHKNEVGGDQKALLYLAAATRNHMIKHNKIPSKATHKKYINWALYKPKKYEKKTRVSARDLARKTILFDLKKNDNSLIDGYFINIESSENFISGEINKSAESENTTSDKKITQKRSKELLNKWQMETGWVLESTKYITVRKNSKCPTIKISVQYTKKRNKRLFKDINIHMVGDDLRALLMLAEMVRDYMVKNDQVMPNAVFAKYVLKAMRKSAKLNKPADITEQNNLKETQPNLDRIIEKAIKKGIITKLSAAPKVKKGAHAAREKIKELGLNIDYRYFTYKEFKTKAPVIYVRITTKNGLQYAVIETKEFNNLTEAFIHADEVRKTILEKGFLNEPNVQEVSVAPKEPDVKHFSLKKISTDILLQELARRIRSH